MPQIPLSQGKAALVDDEDFARFRWCFRAEQNKVEGYAVRHVRVDGRQKLEYLHRAIANPPPGYEVVFANHNKLDCRRENMRVVTTEEARRHHRVRRDSASGLKNIVYNRSARTWSVNLTRHGYSQRIGT
jgi:hypothetical protein